MGQSNSANSSQNMSVFAARVETWSQENRCNFVNRAPFFQKILLTESLSSLLASHPAFTGSLHANGFDNFLSNVPIWGHSRVVWNPGLKTNGPFWGHSRVVSNPGQKYPSPNEKTCFLANGPIWGRSGVKGLSEKQNKERPKRKTKNRAANGAIYARYFVHKL